LLSGPALGRKMPRIKQAYCVMLLTQKDLISISPSKRLLYL
jgi:hypothetical protein